VSNILRFGDLVARGIVRNKTSLKRWVEAGQCPAGFRLTPGGTRAWTDTMIDEWLATRQPAGEFVRPYNKTEQS
jgi:hypothetical protein